MPGDLPDQFVHKQRIAFAKRLIRGNKYRTLGKQVAEIRSKFAVSLSTAYRYIHIARDQIGQTLELDDPTVDQVFMESVLEVASGALEKTSDRLKALDMLAKFRGRYKQVTASEQLAPVPPIPHLDDPHVLDAALAYDAALDAARTDPGSAGPVVLPDAPVGEAAPAHPSAPDEALDRAIATAEWEGMQAPDDPNAAPNRQIDAQ